MNKEEQKADNSFIKHFSRTRGFIKEWSEDIYDNVLKAMINYELDESKPLRKANRKMDKQLYEGREYLMQVDADKITVADALEAFGFGRNGLK